MRAIFQIHKLRPDIIRIFNAPAKRFTLLAAALGMLAIFGSQKADAAVLTYDIGGIESIGDFGDPANETRQIFIAPGAHITAISYDVVLSAFDPSWLGEMGVDCSESTYTTGALIAPGSADAFSGLNAAYSSNGFVDLAALNLDFFLGADGILLLTFRESWDDDAVNPDGLWVSGNLGFQYTVPEPSSALLAALGLGAVTLSRRKSR